MLTLALTLGMGPISILKCQLALVSMVMLTLGVNRPLVDLVDRGPHSNLTLHLSELTLPYLKAYTV